MVAGELDVVQRARFELDRAELEAYAAKVRTGDIKLSDQQRTRQIGSLPITRVDGDVHSNCVRFEIDDVGFLSLAGYVQCLAEPPTEDGYRFEAVSDGWYAWTTTDP